MVEKDPKESEIEKYNDTILSTLEVNQPGMEVQCLPTNNTVLVLAYLEIQLSSFSAWKLEVFFYLQEIQS